MKYKDIIFGEFEIKEKVLLELINSSPIQRLKNIDIAGYYFPFLKKGAKSHTRYDHSMGVFLLLRKFNASIEEQIAGLIHDVSHLAFSHAAEYALDLENEGKQEHQDKIFKKFVVESDIGTILKKYKFDLEYLIDTDNFSLLENQLPDICADRLDYSFRHLLLQNVISKDVLKSIISNLKTFQNKFIFSDFKAAYKYAKLFKKLNDEILSGIYAGVMFRTLGEYLHYALKNDYINEDDFFTDDQSVLRKIEKYISIDKKLALLKDRMEGKVKFINNPNSNNPKVIIKSRIVDPPFFDGNNVKKLSEKIYSWGDIVSADLKPNTYYFEFDR